MSKKKLDEITPSEATETPVTAELLNPGEPQVSEHTHSALGIYRSVNGTEVRHVLIEIKYNPETKQVGHITELAKDIREDIIDKFKTEVFNKGVFGE